ncbi:break repair meiotic recombinase recruitment factor 1 [Struthio camelus]|uniref:break repair meiotic recombinase recruitment factor 1 n=1 Tax=Struthio camelus TaxID=8801 RepID=UPI003603FE56
MSKRKNDQRSGGDSKCSVSKMKRLREDPEVTEGLDLTGQTQIMDSEGKSKPTAGGAEEREEKDPGSTESLEANSQASSNDEGEKTAAERSQAKQFTSISLSQKSAGKFVPVFTRPKEALAEKRKRNNGVAPRSRTEQEIIVCNTQNMDISLEQKPSEAVTQKAKSQAEASEQANLIVVKMEEDHSVATPERQRSLCEELDKPQTCLRMKNISNNPENDLVLPEQQGEGTASRLQDDPCEKTSLIEAASVFPDIPEKSIGNCQDRSFSAELPHNKGLLCESVVNAEQNKTEAVSDSWVKEESSEDVNGEQQSVTDTEGKNETAENVTESLLKNPVTAKENNSRAQETAEKQSRGGRAARQSSPGGDGNAAQPSDRGSGGNAAEPREPLGSGDVLNAGSGAERGSPPCAGRDGEHGRSDSHASGRVSGGCTPAVELKMEVDLSESENAHAPSTVSPVCPEAESMSHLESCNTLLHTMSYKGEADRGREEAEEAGILSLGTSSVSEPDSTVSIHGDSVRKRKQEDLPEEQKENGSEKVRPSKEHSRLSTGEPNLNRLGEKLPNTEIPPGKIQILEAEGKPTPCSLQLDGENAKETALTGKTMEPIPTESTHPPSRVLAQLEKGAMASHSDKADANSDDRKFLSAADKNLPGGIPADTSPEDKTCSTGGDELSLELELLPDSDLQAVLKDSSLKFPPQQPFSADNKQESSAPESQPCAERGQSHLEKAVLVPNINGPGKLQPSAEVMEGIYDPSQKEDATDVVCGLIAELSNLNRLIMSAHRDLESLKRLKYRKSRRSGKFPPHPPRGAPTGLNTGKKWKDM